MASRKRSLNKDKILNEFPDLAGLVGPVKESRNGWACQFIEDPEVMHNLLADYIKQANSKPGRVGQRPMPLEEDVEEIRYLLHGTPNDRPLVEVLPGLLGDLSVREASRRSKIPRATFARILNGTRPPDAYEMECIAEAVGKPPSFFIEYRRLMAVYAFLDLLDKKPGLATRIYRDHLVVGS